MGRQDDVAASDGDRWEGGPAMLRQPARHFVYQLSPGGSLAFSGVVLLLVALVAGRSAPHLWQALGVPTWRQHVSNFALSGLLVLGAGTNVVLGARPRWQLWGWAGLVAVTNLVVETVVTVLNTPDPVDAAAGVLAVAVTVPLLLLIERHGLRPLEHGAG